MKKPRLPRVPSENLMDMYNQQLAEYEAWKASQRTQRQTQRSRNFGNGEVYGDNRWTPPVYGTTESGQEVTASFGTDSRAGHTGIRSGHVADDQYYGKNPSGHDHFGPNGEPYRDLGRYKD